MPRINKKHFIIYNNQGVISATTPKDWARANQGKFPDYDFSDSDNTPPSTAIENYLINNLGYSKVENDEIVICYPYSSI